jgi:hypothetical protein
VTFGTHAVGVSFDAAAPRGAPAAELAALGAALPRAEALTSLDLSRCAVDDAGAAALASALARTATLTRLDLSYNDVGDAGAAALASLAAPPPDAPQAPGAPLAHLLLTRNALRADGAAALAAALQRPSCALLELDLRLNAIGDDGGAEILLALAARRAQAAAAAAASAPAPAGGLVRLHLGGNELGLKAAVALGAALRAGGAARLDCDLSNNPVRAGMRDARRGSRRAGVLTCAPRCAAPAAPRRR